DAAVQRFADRPHLTRLRTELAGIDPDESYSQVPYQKGALFLRTLEHAVGRARFDAFHRAYLARHAFQSLTTGEFLADVERELPGVLAQVDAKAWVFGDGVPANAPAPESQRLRAVKEVGAQLPADALAHAWKPLEWQLYLDALPRPAPRMLVGEL